MIYSKALYQYIVRFDIYITAINPSIRPFLHQYTYPSICPSICPCIYWMRAECIQRSILYNGSATCPQAHCHWAVLISSAPDAQLAVAVEPPAPEAATARHRARVI